MKHLSFFDLLMHFIALATYAGTFAMIVITFPLTSITILTTIGCMVVFSIHQHYQDEHQANLWWFEDLYKARNLGTHPKPTTISQWVFEKFLDFELSYYTKQHQAKTLTTTRK